MHVAGSVAILVSSDAQNTSLNLIIGSPDNKDLQLVQFNFSTELVIS